MLKIKLVKNPMDQLPRDVQLKVISKMDIDTRLSLGILPCKIKVPFKDVLEQIQKPFNGYVVLGVYHGPWYTLTHSRTVITRSISYYSDDFVTFKLLGF
jgi:hypothetical protein